MAESTWRYKRNDGEEQTASESELQDMLAAGTLPADTPVWADYLGQWTPASQIAAFAARTAVGAAPPPQPEPASPQPEPASPQPEPASPQPEPTPELISPAPDMVPAPDSASAGLAVDVPPARKPHPWLRFWARMIDTNSSIFFALFVGFLTAFLFGFITGLFKVESETLSQNIGYFGMVLGLLTYLWLEPVCLSACGSTLGKFLFNIRLRNAEGSKLTFRQATKRAFDVWLRGGGLASCLMIPFISGLIAIIQWCHAYGILDRTGSTTWDKNGGFIYEHHPIGVGRGIAIFVAFMFPLFVWFAIVILAILIPFTSNSSSL